MDIAVIIILGLIGIALILVEVFLIPGITIAAIVGVGAFIGATWYAFAKVGSTAGVITLISSVVLLAALFVYLIKSKALNTIGLKTNIDSTVASDIRIDIHPGDEGITLSRLNPMGKVKVNGTVMEAKSQGDYIDVDVPVEVLKVSPTQLIVKTK